MTLKPTLVAVLAVLLASGAVLEVLRSATAAEHAPVNKTSLLGSSRTSRDAMPGRMTTSPLLDGMNVVPDTSRRLERQGGPAAWVVQARGGKLCMISGGSAGCAPASVLADRGLLPQIAWSHGVLRIEGVAADAVTGVRVTFQDGGSVTIPVNDGAFLLTTSRIPRRLEWRDTHGAQSLAVRLPSDLLAKR